jgi:hypothetical protein
MFSNVITVETYTHGVSSIDAIDLRNLENVRRGQYYGVAATWTPHQKRMLDTYLLYRSTRTLLHEEERRLRPTENH